MRITTILEPGAAWAGRAGTLDADDDADPEQAASAKAAAVSARASPLASVRRRGEAVERLLDEMGRVTELDGYRSLAGVGGLDHRRPEADASRTDRLGVAAAQSKRPPPLVLHAG